MFKPLLAPGEDPLRYPDYFKKLQYPLLCSPKYDGIRCIVKREFNLKGNRQSVYEQFIQLVEYRING